MKAKSIFSIGLEFQALADLLDNPEIDENGEFVDNEKELNQLLSELNQDMDSKLNGYMYIIKDYKAKANIVNDEIKRLTARKKAFLNNAQRLEDRVFEAINLQEDKKYKTDLFNFSIRKSESLEVTDESQVPSDYIEFTRKVNKAQLKKDIKSGKVEAQEGFYIKRNEMLGVR